MNPLPTYSTKAIWKKAVEISGDAANVKKVLRRIGKHLNHEGRRSSISVTQIASDCRLSKSTVHRILRVINGVWVGVEFNKGIKRSTGRENLYHAIIPEALAGVALDALQRGVTNCGKGCQPIVARGAGKRRQVTEVLSKRSKTVKQRKVGEEVEVASPPPRLEPAKVVFHAGATVIDFAAARERIRATSSQEVVL
jgi:hypothetical protein